MEEIQTLSIDQIDEPMSAMRTDIPRDAVFELAADIKQNGLINPITVRPLNGRYEIVAGHRRFLAHRYGGMATIKCVVRELTDAEAFAVMTSENLVREDVNPVDEAIHVGRLMEMFGGEIGKVSEIMRKSTSWVSDRILIAQMPDDLKMPLREGKLKLGVALALHEIKNDIDRGTCLQTALVHGSSVLMAQYYAAQWRAGLFGVGRANSEPDSELPQGERREVLLRCAVDDKEYPATEFVTFLVHRPNAKYIVAMREHLKNESAATALSGGGNPEKAGEDGSPHPASIELASGASPVGALPLD